MNGGRGFPAKPVLRSEKTKKIYFFLFPLIREPVNGTQVGSLEDFCRVNKGTQVGSLEDKSRFGRYRSALEVRTREQLPQDWAMTQNNLGNALSGQAARGLAGEAGFFRQSKHEIFLFPFSFIIVVAPKVTERE